MIQQRSTIHQSYFCPRERRVRQRPVMVAAKLKLEGQTFKLPKRKSKWGQLVQNLFRRAV